MQKTPALLCIREIRLRSDPQPITSREDNTIGANSPS